MIQAIVRVFANAVITRYTSGEGTIQEIIDSYTNITSDDKTLILAEVYNKRPDLAPQS